MNYLRHAQSEVTRPMHQDSPRPAPVLPPNDLADWTYEEMYGPRRQKDDSYWEEYFNEISHMYAEGMIQGYPRTVDADQKVGWTDAAEQWYKVLKAKKAGLDAARKTEQAAATQGRPDGVLSAIHPWCYH